MGITLYHTNGLPKADWNDETQTVTTWDASGKVVSTRPYNASELQLLSRVSSIVTKQELAQYLSIPIPNSTDIASQVELLTKYLTQPF